MSDDPGKALWNAVYENKVSLVRALCNNYNQDRDVINWIHPQLRTTPLRVSCVENLPDCTELLVKTDGINVNVLDKHGFTPLWWACYYGNYECVQWLLTNRKLNINLAPQNSGKTPLAIAYKGSTQQYIRDDEDDSSMAEKRFYGCINIVNLLQRKGARYGGSKKLKKTKRRYNKKRKSVKKKTN